MFLQQSSRRRTAEHAKTAHGIDNITPELAQKVKAAIKNEQLIQVQKKICWPQRLALTHLRHAESFSSQ
jgi:hypothetical protein